MRKVITIVFLCSIVIIIPNLSFADSATLNNGETTTSQQNIDGNGEFLTISNNSTLNTGATKPANVTGNNVDVTVESGSTITSNKVSVFADDTSDLTVTNSGTIYATGTNAIDAKGTTDATIVNNSGGTISSNRNTIRISKTGSNNTTGMTITNSGTITARSSGSAIFGTGANNTASITNKSGGEMTNSDSSNATIRVGASSIIVNSGSIKNSVGNDAIKLYGNNSTITLKDGGIVVGKIDALLRTGSTLKFNHGVGQGYFYETEGDFTLQDLDGNQIVKGSAGSVGQGGSETLDELLSYKSMNLRQFFNNYKNSEEINDKKIWGDAYVSNLQRDAHTSNLAIEYDLFNFGINLINPMNNANFIIAFEGGTQDFVKDHKIDYKNISTGIYLPQKNNSYFDLDAFILAGITLKEGQRTILTNTTTSGKLNIDSDYETYEIHTGLKKNNLSLIPDVGLAASYSMTPNYDESKYFSWNDRHIGNFSIFFSDDYNLFKNNGSKLLLGWTLDLRSMIGDKKQVYSINGTSATYEQLDDLTKEISLLANIGYEKRFSENSEISFTLDVKDTNQYARGIGANISLRSRF